MFRIRKDIAGPKKAGQEASSIKDPLTGELLVTHEDIKKATVKYCAENLKGNKPDDTVKDIVNTRKLIQLKKMEDDKEPLEINHDDFIKVIEKFGKKSTKTYDFLIKAGKKYQDALFSLCKRIIDQEDVPDSFRRTTLYMIWKRKGPMNILKNNPFLLFPFLTERTFSTAWRH